MTPATPAHRVPGGPALKVSPLWILEHVPLLSCGQWSVHLRGDMIELCFDHRRGARITIYFDFEKRCWSMSTDGQHQSFNTRLYEKQGYALAMLEDALDRARTVIHSLDD